MIISKRRNKKIVKDILSDGYKLKIEFLPYKHSGKNYCTWIVGIVVSKSTRAMNDWMQTKVKRKRVKKINNYLPKKRNVEALRIAVNAVKKWIEEMPKGDSLAFKAQAKKTDQLFRVYKKWFETHENISWTIHEDHKALFFYKKKF